VLEPGRTLTLAERGGEGAEEITAAPGFRLVATMNPGGDYGKRELSPALANRFTAVWVPPIDAPAELAALLDAHLAGGFHMEHPIFFKRINALFTTILVVLVGLPC
jgi:midasin